MAFNCEISYGKEKLHQKKIIRFKEWYDTFEILGKVTGF